MSAFVKPRLKLLKESLAIKDWDRVYKYSTEVLSFESNNYNARVFLSLALFNLDRFDEAEESYKKAIETSPTQSLARQGLASFYEKRLRYSDYAWSLLELMELFREAGDAIKFAETLQKLIDVRRSHGTRIEVVDALSHLLPGSTSSQLLATLPPANPTSPTASSVHSIQIALISILPTLLEVITLVEKEEATVIEAEVKKRRQRLGGQTLSARDTQKAVEAERMITSRLPSLYTAVLNDPDASEKEELRREMETRLLVHWRTLLAALPSSFDPTSLDLTAVPKRKEVLAAEMLEKERVRKETEALAKGMVLIKVRQESAWNVVLEWGDRYGEWEEIDWLQLNEYLNLFPETGLARVIDISHRSLLHAQFLAAQHDDDKAEEDSVPTADEIVDILEQGLAASPDSLLAHLLALHFFAVEEEWDAVVQIAETGLEVLERIQSEIGRYLPSSRRTLESHLAIALVQLAPPTHHLHALRLLESLLHVGVTSELLTAKAYVYQAAEKWLDAINVWDQILTASQLSDERRLEAKGERAWCLVKTEAFESAETNLLEVVEALELLKQQRDVEKATKEKARSKAGIERAEGAQEGETTVESYTRARAWWRLGICRWESRDQSTADQTTLAHAAFVSSIHASPTYAPAFTSLGLYYRALPIPDNDRASKCFQKAFELDGAEELAARYLAEEFTELEEWDLVEVIARRVVDRCSGKVAMGGKVAVRLAWAWKAIGGAELNAKKYTEAIVAFQSALRGAPHDAHTWIKLGIAYRSSGKHIPALKVFARVLLIDPESWYARFLIGDVQREIGLLEPAIIAFRSILVERPDDIGVGAILAETTLALGQQELASGYFARAEGSFVDALKEATKIIKVDLGARVAWKVAADALVGLGAIVEGSQYAVTSGIALDIIAVLKEQEIDGKIVGMDVVTTINIDSINSDTPAYYWALAILAFKMRVLLETQNESAIGSAWLDLGIAISTFRSSLSSLDLSTSSDDALHQAIRCLKFALHKEPMNSIFWNALGVLAFDLSPRLSQHAFIKSIEYQSRDAVPWTNLGVFYLVHGDHDLANQAFLKAQVIDPDGTAAWVGQAVLAEVAGHRTESATLFEHAFTLVNHLPEADIGFAMSAFAKYRSAPLDGPTTATAALSAPIFALTRYLASRPTDVSALHLNGLLLERVGDLATACESFERAATLLEELYEVDESAEVEAQFVIAQTNLGRVRLANLNYEGALGSFDAAFSLLVDIGGGGVKSGLTQAQSLLLLTECRLGSGLAQYFLGNSDAAIEALEAGLEDIEEAGGTRRAELDVALGKVHWSRGNEDSALAAFMDCPDTFTEAAPLSLKLIMQSVAIINSDRRLAEASDGGTKKNPLILYHPELIRLLTLRKLVNNDSRGAVSVLSRSIHAEPWGLRRRLKLATLLLQIESVKPTSPDDATVPQQKMITERLMRTRLFFDEDAEKRATRTRLTAVGKIIQRGNVREEVEKSVGLMETSVHLMPWDKKTRRVLEIVQKM